MPPIWLIVGIVAIFAFIWLADRLVLRPRSAVVTVNGREIFVRRRRDHFLLVAAIMALSVVLVVSGALIEQNAGLLPPAVLFGGFIVVALLMSTRLREKQVK